MNALGVPIRSHVIKKQDVTAATGFMDRRGYELLVIGYAGPASIYDKISGNSVGGHLVELSPCSVLVIK